ncbi:MAG TPA: RHS repeat-associated core domain-containing protein [Longimicrobium sp.]
MMVLHNDWRGEYDIGSYAFGSLAKPCVRITRSSQFQTIVPGGSASDWPKAPSPQNTSWYHCVEVEWPAPHVFITRETRNRSLNGPNAWVGTLIDGMRDNTGQMYMRNRYYDPASGRFTQEDPIGLAGGLNVYGFAEGDPVSFGDPFGTKLCFRGPGRIRLVTATMNATNTTFSVDRNGCILENTIRARGAAGFEELQDKLKDLVSASETHTVAFQQPTTSECPRMGSCTTPDLQRSYIQEEDTKIWYVPCDPYRFPRGGRTTLESSIAHEVLGHQTEGPVYGWLGARWNWEGHAIKMENYYHSAVGEARRCGHGILRRER